jgi:hypothetical protein
MKGVFVYESQPRSFEAVKTKDAPPPKGISEATVLTCWDRDKPESQKNPRRSQTYIVRA